MNDEAVEATNETGPRPLLPVLLFWAGYVVLTLAVGFATASTIRSEVWQLTVWGFASSAGLIALSRLFAKRGKGPRVSLDLSIRPASLSRFAIGFLVGLGSFGVHLALVVTLAGPIRLEWEPGIGIGVVALFFARFLSTSCMEELGFRGYALQRLTDGIGVWPAVCLTAVAFGLSHLLYGWDLRTIALGVVPCGMLWGMSAVATRGLAVPIGLHAAWNFAAWSAGSRKETGMLQMIIADDAVERTQLVGTVSYLMIFGGMTLVFWLLFRRNPTTEPASR